MSQEPITNIDPETGEILEEPPQNGGVDGEVELPPPSFLPFFQKLMRGAAVEEMSAEFQKLNMALADAALYSGGSQKGSITLKIDLTRKNELTFVKYDIKRKDPNPPRPESVTYHTADGVLLFEDPRQQKLPLKVAGFAGGLKNA